MTSDPKLTPTNAPTSEYLEAVKSDVAPTSWAWGHKAVPLESVKPEPTQEGKLLMKKWEAKQEKIRREKRLARRKPHD